MSREPTTLHSTTTLSKGQNDGKGDFLLAAMENEMKHATVKLYTERFNEGYDMKDDELYRHWQSLMILQTPL